MMRLFLILLIASGSLFSYVRCTDMIEESLEIAPETQDTVEFRYLALGDSYTIGEAVCAECSFPRQLADTLELISGYRAGQKTIARTGWTTTNLINEINKEKPDSNYQLVTLLIGVNNQYQGKNFEIYKQEFPELLEQAIAFAMGDKDRVIVVSIPDYAYTPFGQSTGNAEMISQEIDAYNAFAKEHAISSGVHFQEITDITRDGIDMPRLVAVDGLHPSSAAYRLFVTRLFDRAYDIIK